MSDAPIVLFVDDNDAVRLVLAQVLERGGYEVLQAASAEEAYAVLRAGHRPELIITDVVMAGDGIIGLRDQLQAAGQSVPFLVISGYPLAHIARGMGVRRGQCSCRSRSPLSRCCTRSTGCLQGGNGVKRSG